MARRALVEHRPWLVLSLAAAVAFPLLTQTALGGLWLMLIKACAVGFLALYAAQRTHGLGAGLFVVALSLAAAGDAAIELSAEIGGALFAAGHLAAMMFYVRHLRPAPRAQSLPVAGVLVIATPLVGWWLSGWWAVALYALALGGMAALAWLSAFPRIRVGLGALLFVASDWLLFSREGPFDLSPLPDLLVWPLYYLGQFLIATGVVQTPRRSRR